MKWLRLLSFTLSISVAAASVDFGLAGQLERFQEYSGSRSHLLSPDRPGSPDLSLPSTPPEIISEPRYLDLQVSGPIVERCSNCGTQSRGYHRSSDGKWELDRGCHWVRPNDNSDLRTRCD
jgi:hypothetical protein